MSDNYFQKWSHNVSCAICSSTRKREFVRPNRNGLLVCIDNDCWEPKHPLEKPQPVIGPDNKPVPQAQSPSFTYLTVNFGTTRWEDTLLTWDSAVWRWDDSSNIYGNEIE